MVLVLLSVLLPYSLSVCEQAEKPELFDHAFRDTLMRASIGQWQSKGSKNLTVSHKKVLNLSQLKKLLAHIFEIS